MLVDLIYMLYTEERRARRSLHGIHVCWESAVETLGTPNDARVVL